MLVAWDNPGIPACRDVYSPTERAICARVHAYAGSGHYPAIAMAASRAGARAAIAPNDTAPIAGLSFSEEALFLPRQACPVPLRGLGLICKSMITPAHLKMQTLSTDLSDMGNQPAGY